MESERKVYDDIDLQIDKPEFDERKDPDVNFLDILEEECEKSEVKYTKDLVFDHEPQTVEEFCLNKDYLNVGDEIRPWVLDTLNEMFEGWEKYEPVYTGAILSCSIGVGKSYLAGIATAYLAHLLFCLKNPQSYFNLGRGSKILIMNNSTNAKQAKKGIYGFAHSRIIYSPWFRTHMPWNDKVQSELQFDIYPENISDLDPDRVYKNIYIVPGSSNPDAGVGYDLFGGFIDEASKLGKDIDGIDIAEKCWNTMRRRITSRFCDDQIGKRNGFIMMLGSPMYTTDFLEQKYVEIRSGESSDDTIYTKRIKKWDAGKVPWDGPTFLFNFKKLEIVNEEEVTADTLEIPDTPAYRSDFEENPAGALREHAAMSTDTIAPFFTNFQVIKECVDLKRKDPLPIQRQGKHIPEDFDPNVLKPYPCLYNAIHIDVGLKFDALGFSMCSLVSLDEDGSPIIKQDLILRLKGNASEPIQLKDVREFVYKLRSMGFRIDRVSLDGFQSVDTMQILNSRGYETKKISVDINTKPYCDLKEVVNDRRLSLYHNDKLVNTASSVLLRELKDLEDKGKKVDHPPKKSKDCADALCGCVQSILLAITDGDISDEPIMNWEDDVSFPDAIIV